MGSWFEVNGDRMARQDLSGLPYYSWQSHEMSSTGEVRTERPEFSVGERLEATAPGDHDSYFGAWESDSFSQVPNRVTFNDRDSEMTWTGGFLNFSYEGSGDGELLVFGSLPGEMQIICKVRDDGYVTISGDHFQEVIEGWGGISIQRLDTGLSAGPDGLPIWSQVFSGETKSLLIDQ